MQEDWRKYQLFFSVTANMLYIWPSSMTSKDTWGKETPFYFIEKIQKFLSCSSRHWNSHLKKKINNANKTAANSLQPWLSMNRSPVAWHQWQFWQLGWQGWWLTRHLQPPDVSPRPCEQQNKPEFNLLLWNLWQTFQMIRGRRVTFGPQRACLVTQQISVLHIKQQSQSQPSFFWTMMSQRGHFMASPFCSMFCDESVESERGWQHDGRAVLFFW